jgi:hypothetical protein
MEHYSAANAGGVQTGDKYLPEMQRYIAHLVAAPNITARNASLAYLALIQAFAMEGQLQLAWAPHVVLDFGEQEYEVSSTFRVNVTYLHLSPQIVLEGSPARPDADDGTDSRSQRSERSPTRNSTAGRPKLRGTKFTDLLDGLETCVLSSLKTLPRSFATNPSVLGFAHACEIFG